MEESKKPYYRSCLVPKCKNTIRSTPHKLFFPVPKELNRRKQWCKVMRRDEVSPNTILYCCEDHFNLDEDTENYFQYKMMKNQGEKIRIRLKKTAVPHIFQSQKENTHSPAETKDVQQHGKLYEILHHGVDVSELHMKQDCVPSEVSCQAITGKYCTTKKRPNILKKQKLKATEEFETAGSNIESADSSIIAKNLYEGPCHEASRSQSKEKWKNLRSVFVKDMKTFHSKKKPYYLSDYMQFTYPFVKSLNTSEITSDIQESAGMDEEDTGDDPISYPASSENTERLRLSTSCSETPPFNIPTSCPTSPRSCQSDGSGMNNDRKRKCQSHLNKTIIEYFNAKKAKLSQKAADLIDDHRKMFLLSLLPDVNIMSDAQMRDFKRRVLALIDDILRESIEAPLQNSTEYECKQETLESNDYDS